jgi:hypothetical protein
MNPPAAPPFWHSHTAYYPHPSFVPRSAEFETHPFADQLPVPGDFSASLAPDVAFQVAGMHPYASAAPVAGSEGGNGLAVQRRLDPLVPDHVGLFDDAYYYLGGFDKPENGIGMDLALREECYSNTSALIPAPTGHLGNVRFTANDCQLPIDDPVPDINHPVPCIWNPQAQQSTSNTFSDVRDDFSDSNQSGDYLGPQGSDGSSSVMTVDETAHMGDVGSTVQQLISIVNGFQNNGDPNEVRYLRLELLKKNLIIKSLRSKQRQAEVCTEATIS